MNVSTLVSANKLSASDRNHHIQHFLNSKAVPNPYEFTPTFDTPICEVPAVSADFPCAYGVLHKGVGLTGRFLSAVGICSWDWYTDRSIARRQAFCSLWLESPAGREWRDPIPDEMTWELLRQNWQRQIETPDGPLTLFRIIVKLFSGYSWHVTFDKEEIASLQRTTLFEAWTRAMRTPSLVVPDELADAETVPAVTSIKCDICPWTKEPIMAYGSVYVTSRSGLQKRWFATLEEATEAYEGVKTYLRKAAAERQEEKDRTEAKALFSVACEESWEVRECEDYTFFSDLPHIADLDEELLAAHSSPEVSSSDEYLAAADRLDKAVNAIQAALSAEHNLRLAPWLEQDNFSRLRECLQTLRGECPLCGKNWVTDDVVERLVVYGQLPLPCCGEFGLSANPERLREGQTDIPPIVAVLDRWAKRVFNSGEEGAWKRLFEPKTSRVELGKILIHGQVALRLLAYHSNGMWWHVILEAPNLPGLLALTEFATCVAVDYSYESTWSTRKTSLEAWWTERLQAMVERGEAAWLRLEKHPQHGWGARRREAGVMVAYKVSNPEPTGYDSGRDYFCRITHVPENSKKPGFELRIVRPDEEAGL